MYYPIIYYVGLLYDLFLEKAQMHMIYFKLMMNNNKFLVWPRVELIWIFFSPKHFCFLVIMVQRQQKGVKVVESNCINVIRSFRFGSISLP